MKKNIEFKKRKQKYLKDDSAFRMFLKRKLADEQRNSIILPSIRRNESPTYLKTEENLESNARKIDHQMYRNSSALAPETTSLQGHHAKLNQDISQPEFLT